jgi:hypothetical protein
MRPLDYPPPRFEAGALRERLHFFATGQEMEREAELGHDHLARPHACR